MVGKDECRAEKLAYERQGAENDKPARGYRCVKSKEGRDYRCS